MKMFGTILIAATHLFIIFIYPLWAINTILGIIVGAIAHSKGKSFNGWWLYATVLLIVALPHSLFIKNDNKVIEQRQLVEDMVKCKFCAELIKKEAIICRFCGSNVLVDTKPIPNTALISNLDTEQLFKEASKPKQSFEKEKSKNEDKTNALKEWAKKNPTKSIHDFYRENY